MDRKKITKEIDKITIAESKLKKDKSNDHRKLKTVCYLCPVCKSSEYEYDGLLNRVCKNCGYIDRGGFT